VRDIGERIRECPTKLIQIGGSLLKLIVGGQWWTVSVLKSTSYCKGWIKVNPVEGLGTSDPKRPGKLTLPSFDRIIDGVDSEYYTPESTDNVINMISKKLQHSSHTKEAKRIYINLTGKEGDLNEILTLARNNVVRPDRPELSKLEIFYRVGEDLFKFTPTP
jgi:hypothetical protein